MNILKAYLIGKSHDIFEGGWGMGGDGVSSGGVYRGCGGDYAGMVSMFVGLGYVSVCDYKSAFGLMVERRTQDHQAVSSNPTSANVFVTLSKVLSLQSKCW